MAQFGSIRTRLFWLEGWGSVWFHDKRLCSTFSFLHQEEKKKRVNMNFPRGSGAQGPKGLEDWYSLGTLGLMPLLL